MTVLVLRCACCGLPWATLRDGTLEVQSRHNGKIHLNRIDVETLAFAVSGFTCQVSSKADAPVGLEKEAA